MRILNRYVFVEVAAASLVGTILFTLALFLQRVEPVMELLVGGGAPAADMLRLIILTIPQALPFTVPIGVLTGIVVAVGRLSSDNEVLAMTACGIRRRTLLRPVAVVALLAMLACAGTTLWLTPWSQREQVRIAEGFRIEVAGTQVQPRVFIEEFPEQVLWVQDVVPGDAVHWQGVFMADMRPPDVRGSISGLNASVDGPRITVASEAFLLPRPEQNRIQIRFPQTTTYEQSGDPKSYLAVRSESADQILEAQPRQLDSMLRRYPRMDTSTLLRVARETDDSEASLLLHERFALPFACWILPLVGLPLAISRRSTERSTGVLLALGLCFAYWMMALAGTALAEEGLVGPAVAAWYPNALFGIVGVLLLSTVDLTQRSGSRRLGGPASSRLARRIRLAPRLWKRRRRHWQGTPVHGPLNHLVPVLDRYVLQRFLFYFVAFAAAFVALLYLFTFFELLEDMLTRDLLDRFIPYAYYLTPYFIYNLTPLAIMIATLVCFSLLARQHELTAFRACGVSLYRLAVPVLAVVGCIGGALFALEETWLPEANRRQDALRDEIKGRPPRTYLRPDRQWTFGLRDRIFYHRAFDSSNQTFTGISVYDLRQEPFELRRHIHASSAHWDASSEVWVFRDGWVRDLEGIETVAFEPFESKPFPSIHEPPDYFVKRDRHDQQMNMPQLRAYIADLTQSGFDTVGLRVRMHKKAAFPVFAFSMTLLAIPFAMLTGRRGAMWPVAFGLGMVVVYYVANAISEQLGRTGQLDPPLAAWTPCLLFTIAGAFLMLRVRT